MGNQKSEAYRKLQPFGKVPVLDDDDGFESRAICKYLVRQVFFFSRSRFRLGGVDEGRKELKAEIESLLVDIPVLGSTIQGRS